MYLEIVKRQPVLAVSFRAQSFSIAARRSDRHMLSLSLSPDTRRRIGRPHTVFNISSISFEAQRKHFVGVFYILIKQTVDLTDICFICLLLLPLLRLKGGVLEGLTQFIGNSFVYMPQKDCFLKAQSNHFTDVL